MKHVLPPHVLQALALRPGYAAGGFALPDMGVSAVSPTANPATNGYAQSLVKTGAPAALVQAATGWQPEMNGQMVYQPPQAAQAQRPQYAVGGHIDPAVLHALSLRPHFDDGGDAGGGDGGDSNGGESSGMGGYGGGVGGIGSDGYGAEASGLSAAGVGTTMGSAVNSAGAASEGGFSDPGGYASSVASSPTGINSGAANAADGMGSFASAPSAPSAASVAAGAAAASAMGSDPMSSAPQGFSSDETVGPSTNTFSPTISTPMAGSYSAPPSGTFSGTVGNYSAPSAPSAPSATADAAPSGPYGSLNTGAFDAPGAQTGTDYGDTTNLSPNAQAFGLFGNKVGTGFDIGNAAAPDNGYGVGGTGQMSAADPAGDVPGDVPSPGPALSPDQVADFSNQAMETFNTDLPAVGPMPPARPSDAVLGFDMNSYLAGMHSIEDGVNADGTYAANKFGYYGPAQFGQTTWDGVNKNHPDLGLPSDMHDATPDQYSAAEQALTNDNISALAAAGLPVNAVTAYMAHQMGVSRAIGALSAGPDASLSEAGISETMAKNNPAIYSGAKTVGDVESNIAGKMGVNGDPTADSTAQSFGFTSQPTPPADIPGVQTAPMPPARPNNLSSYSVPTGLGLTTPAAADEGPAPAVTGSLQPSMPQGAYGTLAGATPGVSSFDGGSLAAASPYGADGLAYNSPVPAGYQAADAALSAMQASPYGFATPNVPGLAANDPTTGLYAGQVPSTATGLPSQAQAALANPGYSFGPSSAGPQGDTGTAPASDNAPSPGPYGMTAAEVAAATAPGTGYAPPGSTPDPNATQPGDMVDPNGSPYSKPDGWSPPAAASQAAPASTDNTGYVNPSNLGQTFGPNDTMQMNPTVAHLMGTGIASLAAGPLGGIANAVADHYGYGIGSGINAALGSPGTPGSVTGSNNSNSGSGLINGQGGAALYLSPPSDPNTTANAPADPNSGSGSSDGSSSDGSAPPSSAQQAYLMALAGMGGGSSPNPYGGSAGIRPYHLHYGVPRASQTLYDPTQDPIVRQALGL